MVGGKKAWTPGVENSPLDTVSGSVCSSGDSLSGNNFNRWWNRYNSRQV